MILDVTVATLDWSVALERYGLPLAALVVLAVSGHRHVWVFGWTYRAMEEIWKERHDAAVVREQEWKRMALTSTTIAEAASKRERWTVEERLTHLEKNQ